MTQSIEILTIISFGLIGSLGHCIGMCGGFIVTYTSSKIASDTSKTEQGFYHFLYNAGRISSYTALGALFGAFGSLWEATPFLRAILFLIAGILMIVMGLSLSGRVRFLNSIEHNVINKRWYKQLFSKLITGKTKSSFYFLGMLNGLFPCGLVYAALVWAMATGSIAGGALVMFLFGLSTVPALFSFAFFVGLLKQTNFRNIMMQLSAIIVILFGTWTLVKSFNQFQNYFNPPKEAMQNCHCH